jgi:hypothetical protein
VFSTLLTLLHSIKRLSVNHSPVCTSQNTQLVVRKLKGVDKASHVEGTDFAISECIRHFHDYTIMSSKLRNKCHALIPARIVRSESICISYNRMRDNSSFRSLWAAGSLLEKYSEKMYIPSVLFN